MRNSIRKRKYQCKSTNKKNDLLLYNISSIGIIVEVLIGAILGIALCYGFMIFFIVFRWNPLLSVGIFFTIIIVAIFLVLLFKYIFTSVMIKKREVEILEKILNKI